MNRSQGRTAPRGRSFFAEWRRLWRRGGVIGGLVCALALGLSSGGGTIAALEFFDDGSTDSAALVTLPVAVAAIIAAGWFALALALLHSRDAVDGWLATSLLQIPNRYRLLRAKMATGIVAGGLLGVSSSAPIAVASSMVRPGHALPAFLAVVAAALGSAALTLVAAMVAMWLGRPIRALLVMVSLVVVAPLLVGFASGVPIPFVAHIADAVLTATPSALLIRAVGVGIADDAALLSSGGGLAGLLMWATGTGLLARRAIGRYEP